MDKDNSNSKKQNKISEILARADGQMIAMVFLVLLIFIYVFVECFGIFNVSLKTQTALVSTVYETVDVQALVVRDEHTVSAKENTVTVASVGDCEKVKENGEIAKVFPSEESAKAFSEYEKLSEKADYYADLESRSVGQVTDVESLDKDILVDINSYIRACAGGNVQSAEEYQNELNDKFTRRQILIGQEVDFASVISEIKQAASGLSISKPTGYIKADASGIFSSYTDGLERSFDYSSVEQLDIETLSQYMEAAGTASQTDSIGKLITSFDWYFCAVVNAKDVAPLKNGGKVDVAVSGSDEVYTCRIVSGADADLGAEQTVLILKCSLMNSEIASLRLADIEIRVNSYTGIKLPAEAVHVNNGEKGVYALVASVVKWRKADILYTTDDYVVLSYTPEEDGGIKLYDQIVVQGKELHDGKVYT